MLAELWNDLRYRLRALARGGELDREMEDEIQAHLAREAEALERRGLPASEARRQARLAFGGLENVREQSRDMRGTRRLEDYIQDVSYAWRRIRRSPALSLTIVALLALTIGSATLVFSVVNAVLLRPLPFGDPDRLALVWETRANTAQNVVGGHEFPEWARSNRTFDGLSPMIYDEGVHLTGAGDPMALLGVRVAATFFQVMGVAPAIGRTFTADEDSEGRGDAVILSDRLWRSRFASDPAIVGRTVRLNDRPFQVVGVMPPSFAFPPGNAGTTPDLWTPDCRQHRTLRWPPLPLRRRARETWRDHGAGADRSDQRRESARGRDIRRTAPATACTSPRCTRTWSGTSGRRSCFCLERSASCCSSAAATSRAC